METEATKTAPKLTAADLLLQETLSTAELASVLGVSVSTVESLRRAGKLKFVSITREKRLYRLEDVREFLASNVRQSQGES
jgi:excisionase family DNA binding protein